MRPITFALPLFWSLLAGAAQEPQMRAGVWRETLKFTIETIDGKPAPPDDSKGSDTTEDCYTAEEMEDPARFFGEAAASQECTQLAITAARGSIKISGSCTFEGTLFTATGRGQYGETSYRQVIRLNAVIEGRPVIANGTFMGTYVRQCTPREAI